MAIRRLEAASALLPPSPVRPGRGLATGDPGSDLDFLVLGGGIGKSRSDPVALRLRRIQVQTVAVEQPKWTPIARKV